MKILKNLLCVLCAILFLGCSFNYNYPKGGFAYPIHVADEDTNFYYYQLKNIESPQMAFDDSYEYLFFKAFDEPNLSIRPQTLETFRLTYGSALREDVVVVVTHNLITVKKGKPAVLYEPDTTRLSKIERFHLSLLKRHYPIDTSGMSPVRKRYLDSLTKKYPELLDPTYYHQLHDRSFIAKSRKLDYVIESIPITHIQFKSLIKEINESGFWTMPNKIECEDVPTDAGGFNLEGNTKEQYQIVRVTNCPGNNSKFIKACQRIIQMARLDNRINLVWNDAPALTVDTIKLKH